MDQVSLSVQGLGLGHSSGTKPSRLLTCPQSAEVSWQPARIARSSHLSPVDDDVLPSPLRGRSAVHTAQLAEGGGPARAVTEMGAHRAQLGAVCLAVAVMVMLPPLRAPETSLHKEQKRHCFQGPSGHLGRCPAHGSEGEHVVPRGRMKHHPVLVCVWGTARRLPAGDAHPVCRRWCVTLNTHPSERQSRTAALESVVFNAGESDTAKLENKVCAVSCTVPSVSWDPTPSPLEALHSV